MIHCFSPVYFLADSHLPLIKGRGKDDWILQVLSFLQDEAPKAKTLFLVGDIFDFWFEWKHSIPSQAFKVLAELRNLVSSGIRIYYLAGNHDGHIGSFLESEVGLETGRNDLEAEIDGKKIYIIHGDGVDQKDYGYRMLRRLVRWGPTEKIFRLIHPDFGIWFASRVSSVSRNHITNGADKGRDPYGRFAASKLDNGFDYVVMGHKHVSEFTPHPNGGGYLSVGGWMRDNSYGVFENGKMNIKYLQIK